MDDMDIPSYECITHIDDYGVNGHKWPIPSANIYETDEAVCNVIDCEYYDFDSEYEGPCTSCFSDSFMILDQEVGQPM